MIEAHIDGKVIVTGPSLKEILEIYFKKIILGQPSALVSFNKKGYIEHTIEVVIEKIDASVWNQPQSFFDNSDAKKILYLEGYINKEMNQKETDLTSRHCKIEINAKHEMILILI